MKDEKRLELVQTGRMAEVLLVSLGERIKKSSGDQLDKIKANYRAGKIDQATLSSGIAAICALDDFYAELVRDVKTGNSASKDIHDRHSSTNSSSNNSGT